MDRKNEHQILNSKSMYDNPWIELVHHDVVHPTGHKGIYGTVNFKNKAIGILPIDEAGNTYLVGQHRFPLDLFTWEIPEGGCPLGESSLHAAKRELKEETGLVAEDWELILEDIQISNSVTNELGDIYVAKSLQQDKPELEETELISIKKVPIQEAIDMVYKGQISDALSVMALLFVASRQKL